MRSRLCAIVCVAVLCSVALSAGSIHDAKAVKKTTAESGRTISALQNLEKTSAARINASLRSFFQERGLTPAQAVTTRMSAPAGSMTGKRLAPPVQVLSRNDIQSMVRNPETGTPRFIVMKPPTTIPKTAASLSAAVLDARARAFLAENSSTLLLTDPQNEFELLDVRTDELHQSHIRYKQMYRGLEVWARDIVIHTDEAGAVTSFNGVYEPTPVLDAGLTATVNAAGAIAAALADIRQKGGGYGLSPDLARLHGYAGPTAKKVIWYDGFHIPHLAWVVEVRPALDSDMYYFVDARSGRILNSYNNVCTDGAVTGTGVDLNGVNRSFGAYQNGTDYYLMDVSEPMFNAAQSKFPDGMVGAITGLDLRNQDLSSQSTIYYSTSGTTQWADPAAVSAHYNAIVTYTYYRNHFGRNSIDDKGMTIHSTIHATQGGQPMENAFWSGQLMCYGDGGTLFKPLAGGLDVAAHEMTHGVTQYTANLEYQNQSGALNESISDVFGALVDSANWTMGEAIIKSLMEFPSGSLRDLANPHNGAATGSGAWQPASMGEFVNTTQDNGGVHINSGIPNRAFYLAATSIGRPFAGQIWYRALTHYLTRASQFIDARLATEKAATDLFGAGSAQLAAVSAAWDGVGVAQTSGTPPPSTSTLEGAEWVLVTNTDPNDANSLYMVKTTLTGSSNYFPLSRTAVKNRPAVSDASGIIIFVDGSDNLRVVSADPQNPGEALLDQSGIWGSVAIGPGLSSLALTSIYQDTTIYYLDLVNNTSVAFKIITESFDAADAKTALYADALSFDPTGRYLLFDTFNEIKSSTGSINFWNINILDVQQGNMGSVFPPLSEGVNVGNPCFSKTSQTRFTFDYFDSNTRQNYVDAADFNTGDVGQVAGPLLVFGYPTYSGDDKVIAYHTTENVQGTYHHSIEQMPMQSNLIQGTGSSIKYLVDATYPDWFVIGTRTTGIDTKTGSQPEAFSLLQNFPNPFNPTTTIEYRVPEKSPVQITVYDILGSTVATLVDGVRETGRYSVVWDGRNDAGFSVAGGVYFYTIQAGMYSETRKMILLK